MLYKALYCTYQSDAVVNIFVDVGEVVGVTDVAGFKDDGVHDVEVDVAGFKVDGVHEVEVEVAVEDVEIVVVPVGTEVRIDVDEDVEIEVEVDDVEIEIVVVPVGTEVGIDVVLIYQ